MCVKPWKSIVAKGNNALENADTNINVLQEMG